MSADRDENGILLGGDTPFMQASDAWRYQSPGYKATRFVKDGRDETRIIQLGLLACAWNMFHEKAAQPGDPDGIGDPREFMREMIAGANTDLRALDIEPLISMGEVERLAPHMTEDKPNE